MFSRKLFSATLVSVIVLSSMTIVLPNWVLQALAALSWIQTARRLRMHA